MSGKGYDDYLEELFVSVKDREDSDHADLPAALHTGRKAYTDLDLFSKESSKWKAPFDTTAAAQRLNELCRSMKAAIQALDRCRDCVQLMARTGRKDIQAAKKRWHENKAKVLKWLQASGVNIAPILCKVFAEIIYAVAAPPSECGITVTFVIDQLEIIDGDTRESVFSTPLLVPAPTAADGTATLTYASVWQRAIKQFADDTTADFAARRDSQVAKLIAKNGPAMIGTVESKDHEFKPNGITDTGADGPHWFEVPTTPVPDVCITKRCLLLDNAASRDPFRCNACWIRVFHGRIVALILPPTLYLEHQDLNPWLKGGSLTDLETCKGCIVNQGDALFVPRGYVCLWIGLPNEKELSSAKPKLAIRGKPKAKAQPAAKQKGKASKEPVFHDEMVTVGITLLLEPVRDKAQVGEGDMAVKRWLYSHASACSCLPTGFAGNAWYDAWLAAIEPPKPVGGAAGADGTMT